MDQPVDIRPRLLAAFDGCYEAARAAALSGVPVSTVYNWARKGVVVPTISPVRTKLWSYADLMALRIVYWLRHPKKAGSEEVTASPMSEVRRALEILDRMKLDIWDESRSGQSPLQVDPRGMIHIASGESVTTTRRQQVMAEFLDLLGPFDGPSAQGPDLIRPRPLLRIIPGKVSGEPHLLDSRITTRTIASLHERFGEVDQVVALYPRQQRRALVEAIDLERSLAA